MSVILWDFNLLLSDKLPVRGGVRFLPIYSLWTCQVINKTLLYFNGSLSKKQTKDILPDFVRMFSSAVLLVTFFSVVYSHGGFSIEVPSGTGFALLL